MATVLESFQKWKEFLGERVTEAEKSGMSDDTIAKLAVQIGEFLSNKIDPENKEERVLKELWTVADESEKKAIAKCMMKIAKANS